MRSNHYLLVDLSISMSAWEAYYNGHVKMVQAHAVDGRTVRFPANILHTMLLKDGIHGRFRIEISPEGKFQGIERVGA